MSFFSLHRRFWGNTSSPFPCTGRVFLSFHLCPGKRLRGWCISLFTSMPPPFPLFLFVLFFPFNRTRTSQAGGFFAAQRLSSFCPTFGQPVLRFHGSSSPPFHQPYPPRRSLGCPSHLKRRFLIFTFPVCQRF